MTDWNARNRFRSVSARAAAALAAVAVAVGFAGGRTTLTASAPLAPVAASVQAGPLAPLATMPSYSAVVERVAPAVVTVRVEKQAEAARTAIPEEFRDFFGPQLRGSAPAPPGRPGIRCDRRRGRIHSYQSPRDRRR